MRRKWTAYGMICLLFAGILGGCRKDSPEKIQIQLDVVRDELAWEGGRVWNTESDTLIQKKGETGESSIFKDPFYERGEGEDIKLQYIEKDQLYYIRTIDGRYYELCRMDLDSFEESVLYTNCSRAERTYHYLGIQRESELTWDRQEDAAAEAARLFCVIGNDIYFMTDEGLYKMNRMLKWKKKIVDDIDSDTELVFSGDYIYFNGEDRQPMAYDRSSGEVHEADAP